MMNFGPFGGGSQPPMFHPNMQAMQPFMAMQQQQLPPNPLLHPLQAQQLQQQTAIGLSLRGPAPAAAPSQLSWGEAWSESSSG